MYSCYFSKNLFKLLIIKILILINFIPIFSQSDRFFSSVYYTSGKVSDGRTSNSFSNFESYMYDDKSYLVGGFDLLKIKDTNWNYSQNSCIIGINHSFDENYLKFNFAYQAGKFTSNLDSSYNYKDNLRIYDLELIHRFFPYYIGIGGDWQLLTGIKNTEAYHLKFRIERYLNPKLFISLKSLYSNISDNRKLFSEQIYSSYLLIPELLLKASLMIGKRAYYFDSDLLIFFNQDDTQNYLYSIQAEYTLWNTLSLVASYQKTGFTKSDSTSYKYSINYLIAGLKLKIDF